MLQAERADKPARRAALQLRVRHRSRQPLVRAIPAKLNAQSFLRITLLKALPGDDASPLTRDDTKTSQCGSSAALATSSKASGLCWAPSPAGRRARFKVWVLIRRVHHGPIQQKEPVALG